MSNSLVLFAGAPIARITLAPLVAPPVVSIGVAICGLLALRSSSRNIKRIGVALFALGALGVVASAAWIALALYIESVVR